MSRVCVLCISIFITTISLFSFQVFTSLFSFCVYLQLAIFERYFESMTVILNMPEQNKVSKYIIYVKFNTANRH